MKIVTILPVSRIEFLDRVLESLENQSYEPHTSLLVVVDGSNELFVRVHNKVAQIGLEDVLCVKSNNGDDAPTASIPQRRQRIANVHNQIRGLIMDDVDLIFSIEDDGILPINALSWLVNDMNTRQSVGMVTGVELGRWGVPYVGAWMADDVMNAQKLISIDSKAGQSLVEEIDAAGLYCALVRADLYKQHVFTSDNGLGPDVNMAIEFRQLGFKNYIDWFVPVTHITNRTGKILEIPANSPTKIVTLSKLGNLPNWHASH